VEGCLIDVQPPSLDAQARDPRARLRIPGLGDSRSQTIPRLRFYRFRGGFAGYLGGAGASNGQQSTFKALLVLFCAP